MKNGTIKALLHEIDMYSAHRKSIKSNTLTNNQYLFGSKSSTTQEPTNINKWFQEKQAQEEINETDESRH